MEWYIIGIIAALLTTFGFVPQILKMLRTKSVKDVSIATLFQFSFLTIFWNSGFRFNIITFLSPAFAILFYYSGILIENAKRNWFIGIRTPWTLSSDKVWNKTHKIGGKLFKIAGILALGGLFFETAAIFFIIVPVIVVSIYTVVYSYIEYQKEMK